MKPYNANKNDDARICRRLDGSKLPGRNDGHAERQEVRKKGRYRASDCHSLHWLLAQATGSNSRLERFAPKPKHRNE